MIETADGMPAGSLKDYISGTVVRATPEERDAVQVFARRLVEDFEYPVSHVQTHPQYRVRIRPSDQPRSFPVDIAVFSSASRDEATLQMVVECKQPKRSDGIEQLKLYLDMSAAHIGVWFNGDEHVYLRKVLRDDGTREYEELPNIPRHGQRIEDIGHFRRKDLRKPSNLRATFRDLRNYLASRARSITRDEPLARELINILFCKIYDEMYTGKNDPVEFRSGHGESAEDVAKRLAGLFNKVKVEYQDVFNEEDALELDPSSLAYVVGELQNYAVTEADRDAIGDAFEVFIGPALRGSEGQFFTPRNVVRLIVELVDPGPDDIVLDPACGSGGFLIVALQHVWQKLEAEGSEKGWSTLVLDRRQREVASRTFRGLEKDSFLARVTKAYMAIIGDGRGGVFSENTLSPMDDWDARVRERIRPGEVGAILTNPPFGSKISIDAPDILKEFQLARTWKRDRETGAFARQDRLHSKRPPQILFLERCLQLLKPGGRLGMILPESLLGNPSYEYVLDWVMQRATIRAVITMPESLFKTSGKGGTHTKVAVVVIENVPPTDGSYDIFMADAKWCGHDSRGNPTLTTDEAGHPVLLDDVPLIAERYDQIVNQRLIVEHDHYGFLLPSSSIQRRRLIPKYYNPELERDLVEVQQEYLLPTMQELVDDGVVSITTGVEVGKMAYGTGPVPFIRTSDFSNWEVKFDAKQAVSRDLYLQYLREDPIRCGLQPRDILMVRDGTYLIGTTAMITEHDTEMLYQSHVFRIRVEKPRTLSPYLLLAALNSPIVKRQIRSKQFTQDIIDTLGNRIHELRIPIARDTRERRRVAAATKKIVDNRARLRYQAREVASAYASRHGTVEGEAGVTTL